MSKKLLGPEVGYIDVLNHATSEHIKKQREEGRDVSLTPIRPSASGKCARELAYELMEHKGYAKYQKELHTPEVNRIFGLGHAIEYHIIRELETYLKDYFSIKYKQQVLSFTKLESEIDPSLNQWLEGSLDLVLWSKDNKCIADVKSKKVKYSSYRNSDWEEYTDKLSNMSCVQKVSGSSFFVDDLQEFINNIDPFLAMNFYQLNLYACNPFITERGIDHAAIIQYNKNTSELREIRFKPSKDIYDQVIHKFKSVIEAVAVKKPELASKDHALGSMKCAFCNFKSECWSEDDPLKLFFRSLPPKNWPKDVDRLTQEDMEKIEEYYSDYKIATAEVENMEGYEQDIIEIMTKNSIKKIRFSDGEVYEIKMYKSPREHVKLKRSKA